MSAAAVLPPPSKAPTLFDLEDTLLALTDTEEGGVPEEHREAFLEAHIAALVAAKAKRDHIARFHRFLTDQIRLGQEEQARLKERVSKLAAIQERIESYIEAAMNLSQAKRLEGDAYTLFLRKCPDTVEITDAALLPASALRYVPPVAEAWLPDRVKIKAAMKSGEVPGAVLKPGRNQVVVL